METAQPEKYVVWMGAKGKETYSKSDLKSINDTNFDPPPELKDNNWANGGNFELFNTFFSGFRISDLFSSFPDFPFFQFNIKATSFGSATLLDKHGQCMHPGSLWGSIWARRLPTRK